MERDRRVIIALDGAEKVGKTTLAKALVKAWPAEYGNELVYRHWSTSWPDEIEFRLRDANMHGRDEVWDRTYLSEMVYTPLLSRPLYHPLFRLGVIDHLIHIMKDSASIWVLVGSVDRLRTARDGTDLNVEPEMEQLNYAYAAGQTGASMLDVDKYTTDEAVCVILNSLKKGD